MSSFRVARAAFIVSLMSLAFGSAASLVACGEDETVVAVNVNSADEVGNPSSILITIEQSGQSAVEKDVAPPTRTQDGGVSIQPTFFERVVLPDGWEREKTRVKVEAKDSRGVYLSAETEVTLRPGGAVAAFVDLGKKPEMMPPDQDDAGTADAGR